MKKKILTVAIFLVCASVLLIGTLLLSRYGAQVTLEAACKFVPGELAIETVQGRLIDRLVLSGVRYTDETVAISLDQLSLAWNPGFLVQKELMVRSLDITGVDITIAETKSTDNDSAVPLSNEENFSFPLKVTVEKASVETVSISTPEQSEPIRLDTFQVEDVRARDSHIELGLLTLAAPEYQVRAGGELQFGPPLSASFTGSFTFEPEGYETIAGNGSIAGTLDKSVLDVQLAKPFRSKLSGNLVNLAGEARWQAEFFAENGSLAAISTDWPGLAFTKFKAAGNGTIDTYSLHIDTIASYDQFQDVQLTTRLNGNAGGLVLEELTLALNSGRLAGDGKLDWQESFSWKADVTGSDVMLAEINPTWPQVSIPQATVSGHGIMDTYSLDVKGALVFNELKDVPFTTGIKGDGNGMQFTKTILQILEGSLAGKGKVNWQKGIAWQADFSGRQLNPAAFKEKWPGSIDFQVITDGSYVDNALNGMFDLVSAKGEIRGYPLVVNGSVTADQNNFEVNSFFLNSNGTEITLSGSYADTLDMHFQLDASDLAALWPDFEGELKANGTMTGKRLSPALNLDLVGEAISLYGNRIGEIQGAVAGNLAPGGRIDSSINAANLILADRSIDTVSLAVYGTVEQHSLQTEISGDDGSMKLSVEGGLTDNNWDGKVSKADIEACRFGNWSLLKPGSIRWSRKEHSVVDLCFSGIDSSQVCIVGKYDQEGQWQVVADLHSLSYSMLPEISGLTASESLQDEMIGNFSLSGKDKAMTSGELSLAADNLSVQLVLGDNKQQTITWKKNKLHVLFMDKRLSASIDSVLQDDSFLAATAVVDDFVPTVLDPEKLIVDGELELNIRDLNPLSVFTFPVAEPYGALQGRFSFKGPVAHPSVNGNADLKNGRILILPLGITLKDLAIDLNGNDRVLNLTGACSSGDGLLKIDGVASIQEDGQEYVQLDLSGDRFEVLQLPEWRLKVSPQLKLVLSREQGELSGSISLQEGMFSPHSFAGTVSASRDVVMTDAKSGSKQDQWPFSADVTITVDENVRINAFGLKGSLAGKLHVEDLPGKPVVGTGQLSVNDGKFTIYGRELDIKTGKLFYSGGEVDNPGVAVRAENTTQGVKTGVAVTGFLKEPELSFYSDPPMEENEIIARLLMNTSLVSSSDEEDGLIDSVASETGLDPLSETIQDVKKTLRVDDVKVESGKTNEDLSLVIGTWMTPRLYVSYGKNLLKESGSFNTRYVLGKGFSLETESGSTESGFDLKFEIDR